MMMMMMRMRMRMRMMMMMMKLCLCSASGSSRLDEQLVSEVLEDIPRHEEDYLDLPLDEEKQLMEQIRSSLEKPSASSG